MKQKMLVSIVLIALLTAGFVVMPAARPVSAECIDLSGNGDVDALLGPFDMTAGTTITITMTAGERRPTEAAPSLQPSMGGTGIDVWLNGVLVVDWDVAFTAIHTVTYTLDKDGSVLIELDWEFNGDPANTYTVVSDNCAVPGCDVLVKIPAQTVMGQFVSDAPIYWAPDAGATTGLTIAAGKTYLVTGQDATGQFRQIILNCQFVWVPFNSVGPNPDAVWHGAPLPATVVK